MKKRGKSMLAAFAAIIMAFVLTLSPFTVSAGEVFVEGHCCGIIEDVAVHDSELIPAESSATSEPPLLCVIGRHTFGFTQTRTDPCTDSIHCGGCRVSVSTRTCMLCRWPEVTRSHIGANCTWQRVGMRYFCRVCGRAYPWN